MLLFIKETKTNKLDQLNVLDKTFMSFVVTKTV